MKHLIWAAQGNEVNKKILITTYIKDFFKNVINYIIIKYIY